eukprot:TRINITY_DN485_c0_g1_i1.p1 TRINITY_DN485_c0_g1~~TRINITY_DN485_c0_g1_i1.p1  ORF type:complete len:243 (+),score=72.91 TRINITY_DN485_c0_g1_i1:38-730(+)
MSRGKVVVVLGTAANPPHQGHLQCLADGKAEAERQGYEVLWCTLAAAHDDYVAGKMGRLGCGYMKGKDRLKMIELLMEGREGCEWFKMPDQMYGSALCCGKKLRPRDNVKVVVVLGSDRGNLKWQRKGRHEQITVVLARSPKERQELMQSYANDLRNDKVCDSQFFIAPSVGPTTSSTLIRRHLSQLLTSPDPTHLAALASHGYSPAMVDYLLRTNPSALRDLTQGLDAC